MKGWKDGKQVVRPVAGPIAAIQIHTCYFKKKKSQTRLPGF